MFIRTSFNHFAKIVLFTLDVSHNIKVNKELD